MTKPKTQIGPSIRTIKNCIPCKYYSEEYELGEKWFNSKCEFNGRDIGCRCFGESIFPKDFDCPVEMVEE